MARIAVTGHMDLASHSFASVRHAIEEVLSQYAGREVIGVSCIARGADTIFAQTILDQGFGLDVILPSRNYREAKVKPEDAGTFDFLVGKARAVHVMPFDEAGRSAYEAANEALLNGCDCLLAVWDGNESQRGGTGTVVSQARTLGVPVEVVWPAGASRGS